MLMAALGLAWLLSGCAASGPVDNPVASVITWFSYVGGDDIRRACRPGSVDAWRLVYNGNYKEQVRAYDLRADPVSGGAILQARLTGPRNILSVNALDPFQPWAGKFHQKLLNAGQFAEFRQAMAASGFDGPAPAGTFLRSDGYYWAVSACRNGIFHFNAWQAPDRNVAALAFVPVLLNDDGGQLDYNLPAKVMPIPFGSGDPTQSSKDFRLEVGVNGLVLGPQF